MFASVHDRPSPAFAEPARVRASLEQARAGAEVVVVTMHWGVEYQERPSPRQRELARLMAANGADIIIGHHPHVLQTIEYIGSTAVFYSLGNLFFDQRQPERSQAILVRVHLQAGRRSRLAVMPLLISSCRPTPAGPDTASQIISRLQVLSPQVSFSPGPEGWWSLHPGPEAAPGKGK
jgi:poly-gamma-glutamate synthesis protein (capsule biosynthesis protein)